MNDNDQGFAASAHTTRQHVGLVMVLTGFLGMVFSFFVSYEYAVKEDWLFPLGVIWVVCSIAVSVFMMLDKRLAFMSIVALAAFLLHTCIGTYFPAPETTVAVEHDPGVVYGIIVFFWALIWTVCHLYNLCDSFDFLDYFDWD